MASPFRGSRPRQKTIRRMQVQEACKLPLTGKRIMMANGDILHPTKGYRNRDQDETRPQTPLQEERTTFITSLLTTFTHNVNVSLGERENEVWQRSIAHYNANQPA